MMLKQARQPNVYVCNHSFSTRKTFSENLTFLNSWYVHVRSEILHANALNEWSLCKVKKNRKISYSVFFNPQLIIISTIFIKFFIDPIISIHFTLFIFPDSTIFVFIRWRWGCRALKKLVHYLNMLFWR